MEHVFPLSAAGTAVVAKKRSKKVMVTTQAEIYIF